MARQSPTKEEFSSFLLDLYESLLKGFEKPKRFIHMMDAITGLEGEGPGVSGRPRSIDASSAWGGCCRGGLHCCSSGGSCSQRGKNHSTGGGERPWRGFSWKIDREGERLDGFFRGHYVPSSLGDRHPVSRWPMNTKLVKNLLIERPVPSAEEMHSLLSV